MRRDEEALDPFRSLRVSWTLLRTARTGLWSRGSLLFVGEVGGVGALALWRLAPDPCRRYPPWDPYEIVGALGLVLFVCSCGWWINLAQAVVRILATQQPEAIEPTRSTPRVLALMAARFASESLALLALVLAVASLGSPSGPMGKAALIVGLWGLVYLSLGLSFVPQVAALEGLGVIRSIERSWALARGLRLRLLVYHVVLNAIVCVGVCCCVGIFVAMPLVSVSRVESYLALTRERPARGAPRA